LAASAYAPSHRVAAQSEMTMSQAQLGSQPGDGRPDQALLAKAHSQGSVRVIVRLRLDTWAPEGQLPNQQAITAQRDAIAQLQTRLLYSLASVSVTDVKRFTFVPQIAMEVDAAGMQVLLSHPDVMSIEEDVAIPPTR